MSMRKASPHMTSCEALRMINDLCQSDSEKDRQIRDLCVLGVITGKIVSLRVDKKDLEDIVASRTHVPNYMELVSMRMRPEYKHNWGNRRDIMDYWGIK